jgi:uncharacterized protein (TIGR00106 family)
MAIAFLSITPIGKGESVSRWVARAVRIIDRSGLAYQLGPMGTCIEGEWPRIARVVGRCLDAVAKDCRRVSILLKVDYRKGARGRMTSKVESVVRRLGRQ